MDIRRKIPAKRPRRSRAQYVNQACDKCKKRKIRCDGAQPCSGCASLSIPCVYTRPNRLPTDKPQPLLASESAQHLDRPLQCENQPPLASATKSLLDERETRPRVGLKTLELWGPSSSEFTLDMVNGNLKSWGIPAAILEKNCNVLEDASSGLNPLAHHGQSTKMLMMDPLWDLEKKDAIGLINSWCEGVGSLYPVVCRQDMVETADRVFKSLEHAKSNGLRSGGSSVAEHLYTDNTNKMKIILAIGRTLEPSGKGYQSQRLFQSVTELVEGLIWNPNGISGLQILVLVAMYHYHLDDEVRAGRIIGFASRLCLEMGLHRREMIERTFPSLNDRSVASKTFWCVYMFERRTSLGQGIPFSIQDAYIDSSLYNFDQPDPLLSAMLEWTKLAGKAWQALNGQAEKGSEINQVDLNYLDYQIQHWYDALPGYIKLDQACGSDRDHIQDYMFQKVVLFIRKSHLRNLIYRPTLQSPSRISQNEQRALDATEIAKDAIRTLSKLNDDATIVRTHAVFFKHLLLTAFGNLLLAVVNAPYLVWDGVRSEFDMALRLIQALSTKSVPLMRLWQRLQGLRAIQTKLQLASSSARPQASQQEHAETALQPLTFDELFPVCPETLKTPGQSCFENFGAEGSQLLDHVNFLFEPLGTPSQIFDFPFSD